MDWASFAGTWEGGVNSNVQFVNIIKFTGIRLPSEYVILENPACVYAFFASLLRIATARPIRPVPKRIRLLGSGVLAINT